jgi:TolA-binding protein
MVKERTMKKTERHQIKRDELVNVIEKGTFYVEHHARRMVIVVAAVVVLAAGVFGGRLWWTGREEKASFLLGEIIHTYRATVSASLESLQQATAGSKTYATVEEKDQEVVKLADEILGRYGSSHAAPKALYYKGLALSEMKKSEEAGKVLQDLLARYPGDFLAPMARYELARLKEAQGNPSEALIQYQALAEDAQSFFPKEEGLMGVARCQEALGRKSDALKTYQKIVRDFPDSDYQFEAKKKVDELS